MHKLTMLGLLQSIFIFSLIDPAIGRNLAVTRVYVATNGDDDNSGLSEKQQGVGIGPVKTLERARVIVRSIRSDREVAKRPVEVVISSGDYVLRKPLIMSPEDSGQPGAQITYRGVPGGEVRISGGVRLTGWEFDPNDGASIRLDSSIFGRGCPNQLFVNGGRRLRPRLPTLGVYAIDSVPQSAAPGQTTPVDHFFSRPDDLPSEFRPERDTEVVILDAWTASRLWILGYDSSSRRLDIKGRFAGHGKVKTFSKGLPFYIDNAPVEGLQPGAWRCRSDTGRIYYRPLTNEIIDAIVGVVPRFNQLVILRGRDGQPVHDVAFEDIIFEHSSWALPSDGWGAVQAEVGLPAAIELQNCRAISFRRVTVAHTGASGIGIRRGCSDVEVSDGHLYDLGGGGIVIGSAQRYPVIGSDWEGGPTGKAETFDIRILDNDINGLGRIQHAGVGVWSGQARDVRIERNRIHDLFYSGISVGWVWNTGASLSRNNVVRGNVIENFGQRMLSDFAGIYTLGRQENTLVADNIVSGGYARAYGGHGIYADEGSSGIIFKNNVIRDTSQAPLHVHYGADLIFSGNIAENYGEAGIRCSRPSQGRSVEFERNVLMEASVPPVTPICGDNSYGFENNTYFHEGFARDLSKSHDSLGFSQQRDWDTK